MNKHSITKILLAVALAATGVVASAAPAVAAPANSSPGACNMFHTSPTGYAGMLKASELGLGNMDALLDASEEAGCVPH
jgi:hypothetical protein